MVAPRQTRKVFCTVVRVPVADDSIMRANTQPFSTDRFSTRPSDLLPWADPYIARIVSKLQDEVRDERSQSRLDLRPAEAMQAELEPPSPGSESDWEWKEETRWTLLDEW